jgi:hypothetical protein
MALVLRLYVTLGCEKTAQPLHRPIGALQWGKGILCKIQQMENKTVICKNYSEPYTLTKN